MRKLFYLLLLLILGLVLPQAAIGQDAVEDATTEVAEAAVTDAAEARKEKIISNLRMKYSQLRSSKLVINDLAPSAYQGLDEGRLTIDRKTQQFLVSSDDKALYFVSSVIDVSRDAEEIEVELAKEQAEKSQMLIELTAGQPFRGNPDAPVTIVEFSDFQCPYCTRGATTVEQILEKYPNDVKFVFQHFPLGFHKWAKPAAIAANCAAAQDGDAFWTLHDSYFEHQKALNPGNLLAKSRKFLGSAGIDMDQWATCAEDTGSDEYKAASAAVDAAAKAGGKLGVTGTPGFFVNGTFLNGAQPLAAFEPLIEAAKKEAGS